MAAASRPRHAWPAAVAITLALVASTGPAAHANPIPATPTGAASFIGKPATPNPVPSLAVPQHPFMAPNERSNLHNDGYQTDAYARSGPLGIGVSTTSAQYGGLCGSVTFDRRGRVETVCVGATNTVTLRLLDPLTLTSLAQFELPPRPFRIGNPFQNFTGGGYFYLDNEDRAVIGTADRRLLVVAQTAEPGFRVQQTIDLARAIPEGDAIISVLPDWEGRYWIATRGGIVATADRKTGAVKRLDTGEPNGNSFAVGDDGVYIVTDVAMYRFEAAPDGTPRVVWRAVYPNDGTRKPGQSQAGSGTTPTLMGTDLVAITSNADPIDVVVYRRGRALASGTRRELCRAPVFTKGASSSDQSLLTDGTNLIVENNYGYEGPQSVAVGMTTAAGLARVNVVRTAGTCTVAWTAGQVTAPSVVPKLALGAGLVYTYTKPGGDLTDPWYLTALDYRTGKTVFQALAGAGVLFNNNYAPVSIGPDGTAYVGVLGGLVALRDATPPQVAPGPVTDPRVRAIRQGPPRLYVTCVRGGRVALRVLDRRVRSLSVSRGGRTVRDARRPLAVGVRRGGRITAKLRLADGTQRTVIVRSRCRPAS
ncbi:MAG: hypothetical protein JWO02_3789 [Solirubrobacterales bacterium]|nr:hypothetical protein [Solirubrobacterales bacterium]